MILSGRAAARVGWAWGRGMTARWHPIWQEGSLRNLTAQTPCDPPLSVLFFGTCEFSAPILTALSSAPLAVRHLEVICPPARARVRGVRTVLPVKATAEALELSTHEFPDPRASTSQRWDGLAELATQFDVGVAVSYEHRWTIIVRLYRPPTDTNVDYLLWGPVGHLIPTDVLRAFRHGTLNVHPSALPRHRGAAPIQHTILAGDTSTAVSIIELSEDRFDHGRILKSVSVPVPQQCTFSELRDKLAEAGAEALVSVLEEYPARRAAASIQSELSQVPSTAPKITRQTGYVRWAEWTAAQFDRTFRATRHQIPMAVKFRGEELHIIKLSTEPAPPHIAKEAEATPGSLRYHKRSKTLFAKCKDGWIGFSSLQFPTKKVLSAEGFANSCGVRKADHGGAFEDMS